MRPHYSQSSRENATPSSGTSLLASYKGVPPPRASTLDKLNAYCFSDSSLDLMRSFFYGRPEQGHSQYSQKWLERNETRLPTGIINGSFAVESLLERPILSGQ